MTPAQCRMARAALDWNAADLAKAAGIGVATVNRFERGGVTTTSETISTLRDALEAAGIVFLESNSEGWGVRMRKLRPGDRVRAKPEHQNAFPPDIRPDEVGLVEEVEEIARTGPTYQIKVRWPKSGEREERVEAFMFEYNFELVEAAS